MNQKQQTEQGRQLSRREALKLMTIGSLGLAMGGSALTSCAPKGTKTAGSSSIKMSAPDGTKIVTRKWAGLGDEIGLLGLGCMRFPQLPEDKQTRRGELDQEKVNELIDYALEHGVNYFDTAPAYGDSERATGVALSRHERSSYFLATKMSNGAWGPAATFERAQTVFKTSLQNLQTNYFDFYLLHGISDKESFNKRFIDNGVFEWLKEQKAAGAIRHLGFSYHGSNEFLKELLGMYSWDFVQIQMNYVDWKKMSDDSDSETEYKLLEAAGIPVTIMEPIRGGALANVNTKIKEMLAEKHPELTPAGVALTFASSFPGVMCTLSGMSNMAQLKENIATFTDFQPFNEEDNEFLMKVAELYRNNPNIPCTGCQYCMPCPNGVNIPGNFAIYNNASDQLALPDPDNQDKNYKKNRKAFLKHYDSNLADGTRADSCTNCNACIRKCPQHIRIPEYLKQIDELVAKMC